MTAKSPADILADAGRALYGDHWRTPLACDLKISNETIRRWMTGRSGLKLDHGVFASMLALMRRRRSEIGDAIIELDATLTEYHWSITHEP